MSRILISGALYLGLLFNLAKGQYCAEDKIRKCISIAEPMLKDPHLIFPDNMNDIEISCRTWFNLLDCLQPYIDKCFSKLRKDQFNSAVEPPIASVHQMCQVPSFQAEYLQYAGCIKSTVIEPEHCGGHYSILFSEVSLENVRKANLCCAYHNFRTCVIQKTRLRCDGNQIEGPAARFSRQVLDKAFRVLQDQCLNYIPDPTKCSSMLGTNKASTPSISRLGEGRSVSLEVSSPASARKLSFAEVYRGGKSASDPFVTVTNTAQSTLYEAAARVPSYTTNLDGSRTNIGTQQQQQQTQSQMPVTSGAFGNTQLRQTAKSGKVNDDKPEEGTSRKAEATHYTIPIVENSGQVATATQRAVNYGRGISWTTPTTTSTSEIPDWATNTWFTNSQDLTTDEIYPAAGSFGGNNIDEPNQQGLSRNRQPIFSASLFYIFIFSASTFVLN